jgi:hypothetical protein
MKMIYVVFIIAGILGLLQSFNLVVFFPTGCIVLATFSGSAITSGVLGLVISK